MTESGRKPERGREALIERLRDLVRDRPEILESYLFGSYARGEAQAHSDIDVAVFLDLDRASPGAFGYEAALTTMLSTSLGTDAVDVVVLNRAPPLLYHRVLRDGVRLWSRDLMATTTREAQSLSRYCDFALQLRKFDAARRTRVPQERLNS